MDLDLVVFGIVFVPLCMWGGWMYLSQILAIRQGRLPRLPIKDNEGVSLGEYGPEVEPTRWVRFQLWFGFLGASLAGGGFGLAILAWALHRLTD